MSTEPPAPGDDGPAGGSVAGRSRRSLSNSVTPERDADAADPPSPEERVRELLDERPALASTPLASPGVRVRAEVVSEVEADAVGVYDLPLGGAPDPEREIVGTLRPDAEEYRSVTVAEAMLAFLRDYDERRGSVVHLEKRTPDGDVVDETEKSAENSYAPRYREKRYAQLKGFEREIGAGFEEPVVALLSLTASGVGADGEPRPPADHAREIAEAWSKSGGVRETIRNRLEHGLGLEPDEWAYIRGGEPHPGDGENSGYHHDHPAVVVDAAAANGEVTPATFRPAVRTHVAECPTAKPDAHRDAISVRRVDADAEPEEGDGGPVSSVGSYIGEYVAADPDTDLLDEPLPYLVWATTTWATTTQKFTRGRTAGGMITADRCRSEAERGEHGPHGAKLRCTTDAWGREVVECAYCESEHDTPETHQEARRSRAAIHRGDPLAEPGEGLPDGMDCPAGAAVGRIGGETRERWCPHPFGSNTCPLCAEYVGAVPPDVAIPSDAFDPALRIDRLDEVDPRAPDPSPPPSSVGAVGPEYGSPEWEAVSLRTADGEEHEIGTPGSVEYRTVTDLPSEAGLTVALRMLREEVSGEGGGGEAASGGGERPDGERPADGRKAVLDALRGEREAVSMGTVAERVGLSASEAGDYLEALARSGRVRKNGAGWVVA